MVKNSSKKQPFYNTTAKQTWRIGYDTNKIIDFTDSMNRKNTPYTQENWIRHKQNHRFHGFYES